MKRLYIAFALLILCHFASAQTIHSHNDYRQRAPFWEAFAHGAGSIEADLYLRNGNELVVCHDKSEVSTAPLFEELYLKPLLLQANTTHGLVLMVDLKSPAEAVMKPLTTLLARYPQLFHKDGIKVVVSGSRPPQDRWSSYPDYIYFDGRVSESYRPNELAKVFMISDNLQHYTSWSGKGILPPIELQSVAATIEKVHSMGKPIRFWGTSDSPNSWLVLSKLGVDIINTDKPAECSTFFGAAKNSSYTLTQPQTCYTPTFKSDGMKGKPKNIIFIIGDGMSISQIAAAEIANRGELTLLNIPTIGFIKNWALDYGNTDSAAAATAMSTGKKTNNRHISTSPDGKLLPNASEVLSVNGRGIGVISSGDITDATPAAQYAHSTDRDNSEEIAGWLTKRKVDFLAGANRVPFTTRKDGRDLFAELKRAGYSVVTTQDSLDMAGSRTICIDNKMGEWTTEDNIPALADVTTKAIKKLNNPSGFYLMVESAKIDHGGHNNVLRNVILETLKLDAVVAEALRFADRDGNTLVIITGDHETGGLTLLGNDRKTGSVNASFSTNDHTGILIPIFAYGVGSQDFRGTYENTEVFNKIARLLNAEKAN